MPSCASIIDSGDRTDRKKARLKYVLDAWGFEKFLVEMEAKLGRSLTRVPQQHIAQPNRQHRQAHIGVHAQKQPGLVWVGVALPVGRMTAAQMRDLADIARDLGDGDIRLTVWQNLLLSGVKAENAELIERCLQEIGLTAKASSIRAGLIACTGNTGCKFALSNTKGTAMAIAEWVEPRVALDTPINVHLTGCPHSCAQHYIGDIGLLAARVPAAPDSEDTVEGFHIFVGGGFGHDAAIAREIFRDVQAEHCPALIERMLAAYLAHRAGTAETFQEFARRHEVETLRSMIEAQGGRGMTIRDAPPANALMIPDTAPFSMEQRAWLNGFFAGVLSLDTQVSPLKGELPGAAAKALAGGDGDDGAPWHDAAMPIDERMKLAEGRPLPRKLFAAMAQQDCGQCGYLCETYSAAIAGGAETKLNLCAPGGKETSRMLKRLLEEAPAKPIPAAPAAAAQPSKVAAAPGRSRDAPVEAVFRSAARLNGPGSEKDTRHVVLDIAGCSIDYVPGDSFGLFPSNDPALADAVLAAMRAPPDFPVGGKSFRQALIEDYALRPPRTCCSS